jgi:hypothetical protein
MYMRVCVLLLMASIASAETGDLTIHMILHAVGQERYEITPVEGGLNLSTTFEYSDRGNKRTTSEELRMKGDYTPLHLEVQGKPTKVHVEGASATVEEDTGSRTFAAPQKYFAIFGPSPFAVQMVMMRYWSAHGRPERLPILRARVDATPVEIKLAGHESITVNGKAVGLDRYTIANLMFGREILWMNQNGDLAAAMTFAGGLPMEAVRTEYEPALPQLYRSGVAQEMADLDAIGRSVPSFGGTIAIVGATLIDATGAAPLKDSVVLIRNGRIAAIGQKMKLADGTPIVNAKGQTLLPGLWEMHIHASGVEFGPALLAAGITTARDCGGEFDYLVAARDAVEKRGAVGPRLLLAGLVDAGGLKAFGHVTAETPEEGRAAVDRYHAAGFEQIKLYTFLKPDVIKAIADEAHKLGMTVTGHVPQALNAFEGDSILQGSPDGGRSHGRVGRDGGTFKRSRRRIVRARHREIAIRSGCKVSGDGRNHDGGADAHTNSADAGRDWRAAQSRCDHCSWQRYRAGWLRAASRAGTVRRGWNDAARSDPIGHYRFGEGDEARSRFGNGRSREACRSDFSGR